MDNLDFLIGEAVTKSIESLLIENMSNKSWSIDKIEPIVRKNGGYVFDNGYDNNQAVNVIVVKPFNKSKNIENILKAFDIGGWRCVREGGYSMDDIHMASIVYDAKNNIPELMRILLDDLYAYKFEPEHGHEMTDRDMKRKGVTIDGFYEFDDDYYDGKVNIYSDEYTNNDYKKGVFYHMTLKKYLPRIMRQGLVPRIGRTLTNITRKSNPRIYMSLVKPQENAYKDYLNGTGNGEEETVLLKVDLNKMKKDIKIYDDAIFPYSVYVTENIPPYCLEIVG